jgi:ComF family protein
MRVTPRQAAARTWAFLLDIVYPPRCGGCNRLGVLFCDDCLRTILVPDTSEHVPDRLDALVCAGAFQGPLREAVHRLKYESDTPLARVLAGLISDALERDDSWVAEDGEPPVIVPVPLHASRKRQRGYNQAELLARELARLTGWQLRRELVRVKSTTSQVGLHADDRQANVFEAFEWQGPDAPPRVLLVDDVCTTGATLSECAAALMSAGVDHVSAATVAHALGDGPTAGSYPSVSR